MNRQNTGLFGGSGSSGAFALARTVAPDVSMAPADIRRTKGALHRLGHYKPPAWGITEIVDSALFDGLKDFQAGRGLTVEGIMRPGGPTTKVLGAALKTTPAGRTGKTSTAPNKPVNLLAETRPKPQADGKRDLLYRPDTDGPTEFAPAVMRPGMVWEQGRWRPETAAERAAPKWAMFAEKATPPQAVTTEPEAKRDPEARATRKERPGGRSRLSDDAEADAAETRLRWMVDLGRGVGLTDAADNLEHFLDGEGKTRTLTREQARERGGVAAAERENRQRFERALITPRTDEKTHLDYQKHLRALKDGETIRLPIKPDKPGEHEDFFESTIGPLDHLSRFDFDELLATKNSAVVSTAPRGFVATRKGNRIAIEAVIEHRWDDRYDFEEGRPSSAAPLSLLKAGRAKVYENRAGWKQRLVGEILIRAGRLQKPKFRWEEIDE